MTWIYVEERLPKSGKAVNIWVDYGRVGDAANLSGYCLRAMYAGHNTLEMHIDCDGGIFDEETETYFCEEGWYEKNQFEEVHWHVDGTVVAWQPLPTKPAMMIGHSKH